MVSEEETIHRQILMVKAKGEYSIGRYEERLSLN